MLENDCRKRRRPAGAGSIPSGYSSIISINGTLALPRGGALLGRRFLPALVRKDFSNSDLELQTPGNVFHFSFDGMINEFQVAVKLKTKILTDSQAHYAAPVGSGHASPSRREFSA